MWSSVTTTTPTRSLTLKVSKLYEFDGLNKVEVKEAGIGSIVAISGISELHIGDTICSPEKCGNPFLSRRSVSLPSPCSSWSTTLPWQARKVNSLPAVTCVTDCSAKLNTDVSLRVEETDSPDRFKVSGRGELHLSVLIENMRREGF